MKTAQLFLRDEAHRDLLTRGEAPPISPLSWWDLLFGGIAAAMFVLSGLLMALIGAAALYTATQEASAGELPAEGALLVGIVLSLGSLAFLLAGGGSLRDLARSHQARWALVRRGVLRHGAVVEAVAERDSDSARCILVRFQLDGAQAVLREEWSDEELALPAPGARVAVIYLDDENFELL